MGLFNRKKSEERADQGTVSFDDALLRALLSPDALTRDKVLGIPSISACVEIIANVIAALPIKLYKESGGKVEEVNGDNRTRLLNDETGDTLNGFQFKKAMVIDYLIGKGGYAYIRKERNKITGLYYVDNNNISVMKNTDPILKDYDILVNGQMYKPYDFLKFLRYTKDGAQSDDLITRNPEFLSVVINSLVYENVITKTGGNKKGFLKAESKLDQPTINDLKAQWNKMYSGNTENCVVLNKGLDFQEASATSVEMQMNENKKTNAAEACKLFTMPPSIIDGSATDQDKANFATYCISPHLTAMQCALNKDLLLEKEKSGSEVFYFAFDTKELNKGDIEKRFAAYKTAIDSNFMQIDEIRFMEDLPALGLDWIKLGLDSVLYNPKTKQIYTPNTNEMKVMEAKTVPNSPELKPDEGKSTEEPIKEPEGKEVTNK